MKLPVGPTSCLTGIFALIFLLFSSWTNLSSAAEDLPKAAKPGNATGAEAQVATNEPGEIHLDQEAIDRLRREIDQSAARNAEAITAGLSLIEPTLQRMHERQMEAVQSSNRTLLLVAGIFAAVGFVGLIFILLILVRAIGRFSELAMMVGPRGQMLGPGQSLAVLGPGEMAAARPGAADQASGRFQGAIDQLQTRIRELEQSVHSAATEHSGSHSSAPPRSVAARSSVEPLPTTLNIQPLLAGPQPAAGAPVEAASGASRATLLLGKGQALLNLDAAEQALRCFEEVLSLEPTNSEALVKKGMALEKLQDWEQALESYNRAIAADGSLTVAYLYRGGVCNRLQRYREALESYEQALQTEKKSRAS